MYGAARESNIDHVGRLHGEGLDVAYASTLGAASIYTTPGVAVVDREGGRLSFNSFIMYRIRLRLATLFIRLYVYFSLSLSLFYPMNRSSKGRGRLLRSRRRRRRSRLSFTERYRTPSRIGLLVSHPYSVCAARHHSFMVIITIDAPISKAQKNASLCVCTGKKTNTRPKKIYIYTIRW